MKWKKKELDLEKIEQLYQKSLEEKGKRQEILEKIYHNMTEEFPVIYEKYCRDIRYACDNGLKISYEQMTGVMPEKIFDCSVFEGYFEQLKKLVKEYEQNMDVVMDLISAKERAESLCVILQEAEVQLNSLS